MIRLPSVDHVMVQSSEKNNTLLLNQCLAQEGGVVEFRRSNQRHLYHARADSSPGAIFLEMF